MLYRRLLLGIFIFIVSFIAYKNIFVGLVNGYKLNDDVGEDAHIEKDGKIIIHHAVIDTQVISDYLIGLRMPAHFLSCDGGRSLLIQVKNEKAFFIINTKNGIVSNYIKKEDFILELKHYGIYDKSKLDYAKFKTKGEKFFILYKDIDISKCKIDDPESV